MKKPLKYHIEVKQVKDDPNNRRSYHVYEAFICVDGQTPRSIGDKWFSTEEDGEEWVNSKEGKEAISKIIQKISN